MANDIFMRIAGVKGEAKDATHKNEIDVLAWEWGVSQHGMMHTGGGGGAGKVHVGELKFTKYVDTSSTRLYAACCRGVHLSEAVLVVRKAGGQPLDYLKITMEEVFVTAVTPSSRGQARMLENVLLSFGRFRVEYRPQKPDGSGDACYATDWDVKANAQWS